MTESDVRTQLLDAYRTGDDETVRALCARHPDTIASSFLGWARPPREFSIAFDQKSINRWIEDMTAVAERADELGIREPLEQLFRWRENENILYPIWCWWHVLNMARRLERNGDPERAHRTVRTLLAETWSDNEGVVADLRVEAHELLARTATRLGRFEEAGSAADEALRLGADWARRDGATADREIRDTAAAARAERSDPTDADRAGIRDRVCAAQRLSDAGRCTAAARILTGLLDEHPGGPYLAKIHGLLGSNAHRLGDRAAARRHTELAFARSRRTGDPVGEAIYAANLRVIDVEVTG